MNRADVAGRESIPEFPVGAAKSKIGNVDAVVFGKVKVNRFVRRDVSNFRKVIEGDGIHEGSVVGSIDDPVVFDDPPKLEAFRFGKFA